MARIAAIIVGIDGWERYTLPLVESIQRHEPTCKIEVIDNASKEPYPRYYPHTYVARSEERLCYSRAINLGHKVHNAAYCDFDWYIVLSNDVLCAGPFAHLLAPLPPCVAGPQLWHEHGLYWVVGWCVAIHKTVWDAVGGWDEAYRISSVEDVDLSVSAVEKGYALYQMPTLPFVHLDQRQRFGLPGYVGSELHNWQHFVEKHSKVTA